MQKTFVNFNNERHRIRKELLEDLLQIYNGLMIQSSGEDK